MPHDVPDFAQFVEAQGRQGVGIPVLLFTDATLDAAGDADAADAESPARSADSADGSDVVSRAAAALGYDLERIDLFSTEAYLVQNAAGGLYVESSR